MKRGRKPKTHNNKTVAKWLIENKYRNLDATLKTKLPSFVDDSVYASLYIYKGFDSRAGVDVSPNIIFRCLMLYEISTAEVKRITEGMGYDYSERTLRRIAQITRFACIRIEQSIQSYEEKIQQDEWKMANWKLENAFTWCYYNNYQSSLYSDPLPLVPYEILSLYYEKKYVEYGRALQKYRNMV